MINFPKIAMVILILSLTTTVYAYNSLVYEVQQRLVELGYNPGPVDGILGMKTQNAIKKFQQDNELSVTGMINEETKKELGVIGKHKSKSMETSAPNDKGFVTAYIKSRTFISYYDLYHEYGWRGGYMGTIMEDGRLLGTLEMSISSGGKSYPDDKTGGAVLLGTVRIGNIKIEGKHIQLNKGIYLERGSKLTYKPQ